MRHLQIYQFIADIARQGSIRKSAEHLNITPSALTRKIQDFEEELGTRIFERLPQGMRLNAAGELFIRHIRNQAAELDRVRGQLSDLSGLRRGHVAVACSQAFADGVVPDQIAAYRGDHPYVSFSVSVRDRAAGVTALVDFEADLALLLDPPASNDMRELHVSHQPICAVVSASHPLANAETVRLRDCCEYPLAMPEGSLSIRMVLNEALFRRNLHTNVPIQSSSLEFLRNYILREPDAVTFHVRSGLPQARERMRVIPIDRRDISPIRTVLGHLKGRPMSTAAAKFADLLSHHL